MKELNCQIDGTAFSVSDQETELRSKFGYNDLPTMSPKNRIRLLGAFWPHFHLHQRLCAKSGKNLVSVYSEECPYPVWQRDTWLSESEPEGNSVNFKEPVFTQLWRFFRDAPLPHTLGIQNENCEYTDDWWYSRNCYLCHSGFKSQDVSYAYRARSCTDSQFLAFCFDCEICLDLVNCRNCFEVIYAVNSRYVTNSAFIYDCRNCSDCLFCSNLRNKQYCINNEQLTKEQYQVERQKWDLSFRSRYVEGINIFNQMLLKSAWHKAMQQDSADECTGDYIENSKNCENCFFINGNEDCINCVRSVSGNDKNCLDSLGHFSGELCFYSVLAQDNYYEIRTSFNVIKSQYLEYCANCYNCKNCFGCAGLINKEFHIFNKPYPREEYSALKDKIIGHMKSTGEYGRFFPAYFAPVPYSESWSAVHFPLTFNEQMELRFRASIASDKSPPGEVEAAESIPEHVDKITPDIFKRSFWDSRSKKSVRVSKLDIEFAKKIKAPVNNIYYATRLKENFSRLPFSGT